MNRRDLFPAAAFAALTEMGVVRAAPSVQCRTSGKRCRRDGQCCGFNFCSRKRCTCIVTGSDGCSQDRDCCSGRCDESVPGLFGRCRGRGR